MLLYVPYIALLTDGKTSWLAGVDAAVGVGVGVGVRIALPSELYRRV